MKIRVEVDVGPKELREFLGLPDISGLQQDAIEALAQKLKSGSESMDPMALLKGLVPTDLLSIDEWQKMLIKAARKLTPADETPTSASKPAKKKTSRRASGRS